MSKFVQKLFSEKEEVSCMRVMCMISLFIGASIAYISLFRDCTLDSTASTTVGIFVGSAFGGKVWHKFAERKQKRELPSAKQV